MTIIKGILLAVYIIVAIAIIILVQIQAKGDAGLSSTITGSSEDNFYEKNKGRTKEGRQKKWTVIFSVIFAILTIVIGVVWMA